MNKQEQINRLQFRIERIENELGLVHPDYFAMPIKSNLSEKPNSCEPNPYAVDWSNAPEWADSHCFNDDGTGNWGGFKKYRNNWYLDWLESNFTLPTGLDWKLSKTIRPK
jgi:hypothetical protein